MLCRNGFTLLEAMIALLISSVILSCFLAIYLSSEHDLSLQLSMQRIISSAEMVDSIFKNDMHSAGNMGCVKLRDQLRVTIDEGIQTLPFSISGSSHDITIMHASNNASQIMNESSDRTTLSIDSNLHFDTSDILVISDCKQVEIASPVKVNKHEGWQALIFHSPLKNHFQNDAEVSKLEINHYYTDKTADKDENGQPLDALYRQNAKEKEAVIDGVSGLTIRYGLIEGGKFVLVQADEVSDWREVKGAYFSVTLKDHGLKKDWQIYASI